jgi:DNA-nicking Smr family endonuclease
MRRRRELSADERALWEGVTRSVAPLRPRRRAAAAAEPAQAEAPPPGVVRTPAAQPAPALVPPAPPPAPPLAPLGRRQRQRVARGRDAIEARIDLHGLTLSQAHNALLRFLRRAQADGAKFALVVTGKGSGSIPRGAAGGGLGERGALRREVPMWLRLPEFRAYVVGFEHAHIGHGGEGALYLRVRRAR